MLDMLIQGGRVVTPAGVGDWDVGVVGEKIVSVAVPVVHSAEATRVIDARGKIVVPLAPWRGQAYTDYSTHCIYSNRTTPDAIARYHELVEAGFPSVKLHD